MDKIRLGRTDMMVSRIGFGGIPIQRVSEDEAVAVVRRCLELGITFIDTANAYTDSEEKIGKAISGRRDGLTIATKTLSRASEEVESHLKLSLKRLGVDSIDLYQFHNISDSSALDAILEPNGPMSVAEGAKRAGLIKHIGATTHSLDMAKEIVKSDHFETIMFPFNFMSSEAADELLPLAREHDVGFIAMKPLAGGRLGNVTIAFKYLLQFPGALPLVGIQRPEEIEEIVHLLEGPQSMSEAEQREMERIKEELGTRFCRNCDYCRPCPQGIYISAVLQVRSSLKRFPSGLVFTGWTVKNMEKVADCTECGECEEKCPYGLPIRDMIKEEADWYWAERKKYLEQGQT